MCGGGGGAPPPPPPPAPPPIPPPVRNEQGEALKKSAGQRAALAVAGGTQTSTILTGGLGLTGGAKSATKKTLLGT